MPKHAPGDGPINLSSYLSGTAVACGTVGTSVPPPAGATSALICAEAGASYFNPNGTAAGTASSGYCPSESSCWVSMIDNFTSLWVCGAAAASIVHVQFFQD